MKSGSRILAFLLSAAMILALVPAATVADETPAEIPEAAEAAEIPGEAETAEPAEVPEEEVLPEEPAEVPGDEDCVCCEDEAEDEFYFGEIEGCDEEALLEASACHHDTTVNVVTYRYVTKPKADADETHTGWVEEIDRDICVKCRKVLSKNVSAPSEETLPHDFNRKTGKCICGFKMQEYELTYSNCDDPACTNANPDKQLCSKALKLKNPVWPGYVFKGWYSESTFLHKKTSFAAKHYKNEDLYAKWELQKFGVKYMLNGGKNDPENIKSYTVEDEDSVLDFADPVKTGSTFDGWFNDRQLTDAYKPGSVEDMKPITVYAGWTANTYLVEFDFNNEDVDLECADMTFTYGVARQLPKIDVNIRPGYLFAGWYCAETGKTYKGGQSVKNLTAAPDATVKLIAQWTLISYNVKFNANGLRATVPATQTKLNYENNRLLLPEAPVLANPNGYYFGGWNTKADGSGDEFPADSIGTLVDLDVTRTNQTITLYAVWYYDVILNANNDDDLESCPTETHMFQYKKFHDPGHPELTALPLFDDEELNWDAPECLDEEGDPDADHEYVFAGWNASLPAAKLGRVAFKDGAIIKGLVPDTILYAVWKKVPVPDDD